MVDVDVVVVGAGPAGTSVSYDLLCEKKTVIILDRFDFPRFKACAGGLTVKTLNALRYSVDSVIRKNCYDLIIGKGYKKTKRLRSKNKICGMIVRSEFDDFCLRQCMDKGVKFKKIRKIYKIEEGHDYIEIFTDIGSLKSRFLVGADGANSKVRALSNTFPEIKKGLAIQARIPCKPGDLPDMEFDFLLSKMDMVGYFQKTTISM